MTSLETKEIIKRTTSGFGSHIHNIYNDCNIADTLPNTNKIKEPLCEVPTLKKKKFIKKSTILNNSSALDDSYQTVLINLFHLICFKIQIIAFGVVSIHF